MGQRDNSQDRYSVLGPRSDLSVTSLFVDPQGEKRKKRNPSLFTLWATCPQCPEHWTVGLESEEQTCTAQQGCHRAESPSLTSLLVLGGAALQSQAGSQRLPVSL